jgi:hypothetical protein
MNRKLLMLAGIALLAGGCAGKADPTASTEAVAPAASPAGSTSTDVRSPTSTSTEVRSPTNTSTQAHTSDNVTVTGGAGAGNTSVNIYPDQSAPATGQTAAPPQSISNNQSAEPIK